MSKIGEKRQVEEDLVAHEDHRLGHYIGGAGCLLLHSMEEQLLLQI